jgi:putative transposase
LIDEEYTEHPFYGVERMTAVLSRLGHRVNPKRIRRLMRLMGLEAIYPKRTASNNGCAGFVLSKIRAKFIYIISFVETL